MEKKISKFSYIIIRHILIKNNFIPIHIAKCYLFSAFPDKKFIYTNISGALCVSISKKTKNLHLLIIDINTYTIDFDAEFDLLVSTCYEKLNHVFYVIQIQDQILGFLFPHKDDAEKISIIIRRLKADTINKYIEDFNKNNTKSDVKTISNKFKENLINNEGNIESTEEPKSLINKSIDLSTFNLPILENLIWNESSQKFELNKDIKTNENLKEFDKNEIDFINTNNYTINDKLCIVDLLTNNLINELVLNKAKLTAKTIYEEEMSLKKNYEKEVYLKKEEDLMNDY